MTEDPVARAKRLAAQAEIVRELLPFVAVLDLEPSADAEWPPAKDKLGGLAFKPRSEFADAGALGGHSLRQQEALADGTLVDVSAEWTQEQISLSWQSNGNPNAYLEAAFVGLDEHGVEVSAEMRLGRLAGGEWHATASELGFSLMTEWRLDLSAAAD